MSDSTIRIAVDGRGVAFLTLARSDKRNALSARMIGEITDAAGMLGDDDGVRAVVLAADGPVFCAGGDLGWMMQQVRADRPTRMREARRLALMLQALNELPKPLIGRVHGDAFGGGVGMMAVCDHVIACGDCRFGFTETRLGLIPATISPYVIARMGEGPARRVFMSSELFDAATACRLDLVSGVVARPALDAAVDAAVAPYLKVATGAVGRAKSLARMLGPRIDGAVIDATIERLADSWETDEAREGIAAFLEKRPPRWAISASR
ncbi:MAG: crotonase/enoyl-CoA hydratase family protein [Geminicoccaceae bacterium]|nr:crotonase/enoyl-CoA hydratase family protein [Geminicoccaceae bacterium]MCB9945312.1 crotonase/enoyl-CoA hydratase family protein [Geminicoccaceae bacterium]